MLYEFKCGECGTTALLVRSVDDRNLPAPCEQCGKEMERVITGMSFSLRGSGWPSKDIKNRF